MPEVNGVDVTQPKGSGGAPGSMIFGIMRERSRQNQRINEMTHQALLGVASSAAKTELGAEILNQANMKMYNDAHNPENFADPAAQKMYLEHLGRSGTKSISGERIEFQATGQKYGGPVEEKTRDVAGEGDKAEGTPTPPKPPTPKPPTPGGYEQPELPKESDTPVVNPVPTLNDKQVKPTPPNTGNRAPRASKGGYVRQRPGTYKDTTMALKAGHITPLDAIQISPTYARKYASKVEGNLMGDQANG